MTAGSWVMDDLRAHRVSCSACDLAIKDVEALHFKLGRNQPGPRAPDNLVVDTSLLCRDGRKAYIAWWEWCHEQPYPHPSAGKRVTITLDPAQAELAAAAIRAASGTRFLLGQKMAAATTPLADAAELRLLDLLTQPPAGTKTIVLDAIHCELLIGSLRVVQILRSGAKLVGLGADQPPDLKDRTQKLIDLVTKAIGN